MSRQPRVKSSSGFYHVMLRGIDYGDIFRDDNDREYLVNVLRCKKAENEFKLSAFCFMTNHVHFLIQEKKDDIATIMKRIGISYVGYFNKKYERIGPLFQDRFKSEPVEDDAYLLAVMRYIHLNPVAANMVESPGGYTWSSYNDYVTSHKGLRVTDTEHIMGMLGNNSKQSLEGFMEAMGIEDDTKYLDVCSGKDELEYGRHLWKKLADKETTLTDKLLEMEKRTGLSTRKLAGVTGLSKDKILRSLK